MADALFWFIHHNDEHQVLIPVKATGEAEAWELLVQYQSFDDRRDAEETFQLDGITPLEDGSRVLARCYGDEYGLSVEYATKPDDTRASDESGR